MTDPWDGNAGPLMWTITETLIELLNDLEAHNENDVIQSVGANPTTVKNVIYALARFGAIYRGGQRRQRTIRLTPLGSRWWIAR